MDYLIDGYNCANWLARDPELSPAELRRILERELRDRIPPNADEVHVYWDCRSRNPSIPANRYLDWCTMHNVPDADAAIIDRVAAARRPRRLMVVSRDREVTGKSRQLGARSMGPVDLLG